MRFILRTTMAALAVFALSASANAEIATIDVDTEWATTETGTVAFGSFANAIDITSVNSITIEAAHTWSGDLFIGLVQDGGGIVDFVGAAGGNTDLGLGAADGSLGNVATYFFSDGGNSWGADPLGGSVDALGDFSGLTGLFTGIDIFDSAGGDGGAIGSFTIDFEGSVVPEPTSFMMFGVACAFAARRRRS